VIVAYHGRAKDYRVTVETLYDEKLLPHRVMHSPDGFCWGYGGSGPADLARSLLMHFMQTDDVSPWLYQQFKDDVIARLPQQGDWTLTFDQVRDWLSKQVA
jgi:hypothetical protein